MYSLCSTGPQRNFGSACVYTTVRALCNAAAQMQLRGGKGEQQDAASSSRPYGTGLKHNQLLGGGAGPGAKKAAAGRERAALSAVIT